MPEVSENPSQYKVFEFLAQTINPVIVYSDFHNGIVGASSPLQQPNVVVWDGGVTYNAFDLIDFIKRQYNLEHPELGGNAFPNTTYTYSVYDPRTPEPHIDEQKFFEVTIQYRHGDSYGMSIGFKTRYLYTIDPAPVSVWNEQTDYTWIDYLYDNSTNYNGINPENIGDVDHNYNMLIFMYIGAGLYNMPADENAKYGLLWRYNAYEKLYSDNAWTNVGAMISYAGANFRSNPNIEGPDYYNDGGYSNFRNDVTGGVIYNYNAPYPYAISFDFAASYVYKELLEVVGTENPTPIDIPNSWFDVDDGTPPIPQDYKPDGYDSGHNQKQWSKPTKSILSSGMFQLYAPTTPQVRQLAQWLWSSDAQTAYETWGLHALDNIVMFGQVPFNLGETGHSIIGSNQNVTMMGQETSVQMRALTDAWFYTSLGSITIEASKMSGSYLDYVNSHITMYVPCVGFVPLKASDVIDSSLNLFYNIDVVSGDFIAYLSVTRYESGKVGSGVSYGPFNLYYWTGNCMQLYPLSAANYAEYYTNRRHEVFNIIGNALGAVGDALGMSNNPSGALGNVANRLNSTWDSMNWLQYQTPEVQRSGSLSGGLAHCGYPQPYVIIDRAKPYRYSDKDLGGFYDYYAYPTMRTMKLKDCYNGNLGYTEVARVNVDIPKATEEERIMIENILKTGVYVKGANV